MSDFNPLAYLEFDEIQISLSLIAADFDLHTMEVQSTLATTRCFISVYFSESIHVQLTVDANC